MEELTGEISLLPTVVYNAYHSRSSSYDHRLIDGKESVSFLVTIKELLEDPTRILLAI